MLLLPLKMPFRSKCCGRLTLRPICLFLSVLKLISPLCTELVCLMAFSRSLSHVDFAYSRISSSVSTSSS
jgi:hypothetical protein